MIARISALSLGLSLLAILLVAHFTRADNSPTSEPPVKEFKAGDYVLSGPYSHENLTLYLSHGADRLKG